MHHRPRAKPGSGARQGEMHIDHEREYWHRLMMLNKNPAADPAANDGSPSRSRDISPSAPTGNKRQTFPRWMIATLVATFLILLASSAWFYNSQEHLVRDQVKERLALIGHAKVDQIAAWRLERMIDGAELSDDPFFRQCLASFLADPQKATAEELRHHLLRLQAHNHYVDLVIVTPQGHPLLGLRGSEGKDDILAPFLATALRNRKPVLSDLHIDNQFESPHISVVAPIFADEGQSARPLGAVILISDAAQFLFPLIQSWPTPNKTAETTLFRRDGDQILFLNNLHDQPGTALKARIPLSQTDAPAVMAVLGHQGFFEGKDYRGVKVVSVILAVPDSPWFLVSKQDASEVFREWKSRVGLMGTLLAALLGVLGAIGLIAFQHYQKIHYRELYRAEASTRASEEKWRSIVATSPDGITIHSMDGRVEEVSPRAVKMLGYDRAEEVIGKNLLEILDPTCREKATVLLGEMLRGNYTGPGEYLALKKDGTRFHIESNAEVLRNPQGEAIKMIFITRDITERKEAETAMANVRTQAKRFSDALDHISPFIYMKDRQLRYVYANRPTLELFQCSAEELSGKDDSHFFPPDTVARLKQVDLRVVELGEDTAEEIVVEAPPDGSPHVYWEIKTPIYENADKREIWGVCGISTDITERKAHEKEIERMNRLYSALSQINQCIVSVQSREELFAEICRVLIGFGGFEIAWVGRVNPETKAIEVAAHRGDRENYLQTLHLYADDRPEGRSPTGTCIRESRTYVCNDFSSDPNTLPWRKAAILQRLAASISVPIRFRGETWGALMAYSTEKNFFGEKEVALLEEAAVDISFALDHLDDEQKRQVAEAALRQSEAELRESEQRLQFAMEGANDGIWDVDLRTNATFLSPRGCEILGFTSGELKDIDWSQMVHPDDLPVTEEALSEHLGGHAPLFQVEQRLKTKSGDYLWVLARGKVAERSPEGRPLRMSGTHTDISGPKLSEAKLLESEQRLRMIGDNLPNSYVYQYYYQADGTQGFLYLSVGVERVHGVKAEDALRDASLILKQIDPAQWDTMVAAEAASLLNMTDFDLEIKFLCAEGIWHWLQLRSRPRLNLDGRVVWDGVATDVTESKHAREALRQSESKFRALIEHAPDGIVLVNAQGVMVFASPTARKMFGFDLTSPLGVDPNTATHPEDLPQVLAAIEDLIRDPMQVKTLQYRFMHNDGTWKWIESVFTNLIGVPGVDAIVINFHDINEGKLAQQALLESESRFRSLFEEVPSVAVQGYGPDGVTRYWNHASELLYGYSAEEAVGSKLVDLIIPPEMRDAVAQAVRQMTECGQGIPASELTLQRKDGSQVTVFSSYCVAQRPGRESELFCIDIDITERKRVEAALVQSEFFFKESQRAAAIGSYTTDFVTGSWESSEVLDLIFGIDKDYCRSIKGWLDIVHPEDKSMMDRYVNEEVIGNRQKFNKEYRIIRKADGETRWVLGLGKVEFDENGVLLTMTGIIQDITERKRAEEANQQLMVAIDQAAESILFTDVAGKILYVNQGFESATGYTRQEVLGQNPRLLRSGKQPAIFYKHLWETITSGEVWHGHLSNKRKDGSLFEEDATISPIRNADGKITSYVAVKRDVTREVELERQLFEAQKMEAIGQLAGGVAHDYNNILAANMMGLEMILDDPDLPASLREGLQDLKQGEERAVNLTRQLLMFSRRQVMQVKTVELNALVREELKMLGRLLGEHITISLEVREEEFWIKADTGMIEQVIMNLCINARDAMPKGGRLTVGVKRVEFDPSSPMASIEARPGRYACLYVADVGCGMSEETKQRIFEPFFTTKDVGRGTGLGLATVYGIVKQHEGWVELTTELDKGSEFRVFLPVSENTLTVPAAAKAAKPNGGTETILVVEDEQAVRKTVVFCLKLRGYNVFEAGDGPEALRLWGDKAAQIDLLLTDMIMPGEMTGLELIESFQKLKPALPAIVMSGYSNEIAHSGLPTREGCGYLPKPCNASELTAAVRKSLDS